MMRCVKCDGVSVFPAMNEAPKGVRDWRKCLSCGKRWDPTTAEALDTVKLAFEEWQPGEDEDSVNVHGDDEADERGLALDDHADLDVMDDLDEPVMTSSELAMKDVLVERGRKKKEKDAMPKFVSEEHRQRWIEGQRLSRKLKQEAAGVRRGSKPKGKPGRPRKLPDAGVSVPARREPETLAIPRPIVVNGQVMHGDVQRVLDAAIVSATADVQALERTREILLRQAV